MITTSGQSNDTHNISIMINNGLITDIIHLSLFIQISSAPFGVMYQMEHNTETKEINGSQLYGEQVNIEKSYNGGAYYPYATQLSSSVQTMNNYNILVQSYGFSNSIDSQINADERKPYYTLFFYKAKDQNSVQINCENKYKSKPLYSDTDNNLPQFPNDTKLRNIQVINFHDTTSGKQLFVWDLFNTETQKTEIYRHILEIETKESAFVSTAPLNTLSCDYVSEDFKFQIFFRFVNN